MISKRLFIQKLMRHLGLLVLSLLISHCQGKKSQNSPPIKDEPIAPALTLGDQSKTPDPEQVKLSPEVVTESPKKNSGATTASVDLFDQISFNINDLPGEVDMGQSLAYSLIELKEQSELHPSKSSAANVLLRDISECGFSYMGPDCQEGQNNVLLAQAKTVRVNEVPFHFILTKYDELPNFQFAYLFALEPGENPAKYKPNGNVFIFMLDNADIFSQVTLKTVLEKKISQPLVLAHFNEMTSLQATTQINELGIDQLRRKLHLLLWTLKDTKIKRPLELGSKLLFANNQIDSLKKELILMGNVELLHLYLQINRFIYDQTKFKQMMSEFLNAQTKEKIKQEIALELVGNEGKATPDQAILITQIFDIGNGVATDSDPDRRGLLRRAFKILPKLKNDEDLKEKLIKHLTNSDINIENSIFNFLNSCDRLTLKQILELGKYLDRPGPRLSTIQKIVILLEKPKTIEEGRIEAKKELIKKLDHRLANLREQVALSLLSQPIKDDELVADLAQKLTQTSRDDTRRNVIFILDAMDNDISTLALLKFVLAGDRIAIQPALTILDIKQKYSNFHIAILEEFLKRKDLAFFRFGLDCLFKINSPEAMNPIIRIVNDEKDPKNVSYYIGRLKAGKFSSINARVMYTKAYDYWSKQNQEITDFYLEVLLSINEDNEDVNEELSYYFLNYHYTTIATDKFNQIIDKLKQATKLGGEEISNSLWATYQGIVFYPDKMPRQDDILKILFSTYGINAGKIFAKMMRHKDPLIRKRAIERIGIEGQLYPEMYDVLMSLLIGAEPEYSTCEETSHRGCHRDMYYWDDTIEAAFDFLRQIASEDIFRMAQSYLVDREPAMSSQENEAIKGRLKRLFQLLIADPNLSAKILTENIIERIPGNVIKDRKRTHDSYEVDFDPAGRLAMINILGQIPSLRLAETLEAGVRETPPKDPKVQQAFYAAITHIYDLLGR